MQLLQHDFRGGVYVCVCVVVEQWVCISGCVCLIVAVSYMDCEHVDIAEGVLVKGQTRCCTTDVRREFIIV